MERATEQRHRACDSDPALTLEFSRPRAKQEKFETLPNFDLRALSPLWVLFMWLSRARLPDRGIATGSNAQTLAVAHHPFP